MSFRALLQAFATVFPAELPDKTMIATIVLVTRYRRPGWVWVGAVCAFAVHVVVAVAAEGFAFYTAYTGKDGQSAILIALMPLWSTILLCPIAIFLARNRAKESHDGKDRTP